MAFRSVQNTSTQIREHMRRILQMPPAASLAGVATPAPPTPPPLPPPLPPASALSTGRPLPPLPPHGRNGGAGAAPKKTPAAEMEAAVGAYLRQSVDSFDLTKNTEVLFFLPIFTDFYRVLQSFI